MREEALLGARRRVGGRETERKGEEMLESSDSARVVVAVIAPFTVLRRR